MPEIKVLPKQVSELIAAGEVVERPSSVIKELVENSIDAGSTQITVEIKNGGVTFMRVTDNGCGIARDDVATAFLRHATSKLKTESDLYEIATLGFRGEALAAISSVSRVEMLTKRRSDEIGTAYFAEGANAVSVNDAGCPDGTTIIIRDLFFNTPARMKFLKKDVAEGTSVGALLDHIALSHPEISFKFIRDGKQIFVTPGDAKPMSAIYAVCGREFASNLIPVEGELGGIKISGYACLPSACRPKKNAQFVFLNGRYVRSGTVAQALDVAYKNLAMVGRYPAAVLYLTVPYNAVDINVHPAKTEVRFSDERRIFDCVMFSVKNALNTNDSRPEMTLPKQSIRMSAQQYRQDVLPGLQTKADPLKTYAEMLERAAEKSKQHSFKQSSVGAGFSINVPPAPKKQESADISETNNAESIPTVQPKSQPTVVPDASIKQTEVKPVSETSAPSKDEAKDLGSTQTDTLPELPVKYVGEAFSTYILAQQGDSLYLIDKHAAHERILFNQLKNSKVNQPQMLLTPLQVALRDEDYTAVIESLELLSSAGFEIEDFGDSTVLVRGIPSVLSGEEVETTVLELAANLTSKKTVELSRLEQIFETMSCRAAVKAGNLSSKEELEALANAVLSSKEIMYCPHGRPVAIELTKREIEKQFGRIK